MKKVVILLILICLCGCNSVSDSEETLLSNLGYSDEDITLIMSYPEDIKQLFENEFNEDYLMLTHYSDFNIDKFNEYVKYLDLFDNKKVIYLVNKGVLNDTNSVKLKELYNNEYFLDRYEDLYLSNIDNYDSVRDLIEAVNTKTIYEYYTNIEDTDLSKNYLMLINKYHALPSNYEPEDLVDIDPEYGRGQTRAEVYEQYKKLQDDASELGYSFKICSAYRAYDYQEALYNKYLAQENGNQAAVDEYSARPGHSEHQSGLCLDLSDAVYGMDNFGESEASKWMDANCYKYGFIIRYTFEKQRITGYEAEPWQIRYVGSSEVAKDIMDRGITFDEYYACFVE